MHTKLKHNLENTGYSCPVIDHKCCDALRSFKLLSKGEKVVMEQGAAGGKWH